MWTHERAARLKALIDERLSAGAAASVMTREAGFAITRNQVMSKAVRMGLKFKSRPEGRLRGADGRPPPATSGRVRVNPKSILDDSHWGRLKSAPPWFRGVGILELERMTCRFPWDAQDGRGMLYCGGVIEREGGSFCSECCAIVYRKVEKSKG